MSTLENKLAFFEPNVELIIVIAFRQIALGFPKPN